MVTLWNATQAKVCVSSTIASLASDDELADQQYFVSQTTQDTTINVGKSTVAGAEDVTEVAQSFTADGPYIDKVTAYVGKNGTPTDKIVCKLYSDSSNAPGTLMATSDGLESSDLTDSPAVENFQFDYSKYTHPMDYGKKYWIVFDRTGSASDTNFFEVNYKGTASTVASHVLSRSDDDMGSWTNDANGYDLYHVIYAGELPAKDVKISGGGRDAEAVKLFGYNEVMHKKRAELIECTFTMVYDSKYAAEFISGTAQAVTGAYYRHTFGEKSSNDRGNKSVLFKLTDGTNHVSLMMNDAVCTSAEESLEADGHMEVTVTFKCLASTYYEEDDFA